MKPETRELYPELKKIEEDIQALKILPRKTVKLEGTLKKVRVEEKDIEEAKKSIFKFSV